MQKLIRKIWMILKGKINLHNQIIRVNILSKKTLIIYNNHKVNFLFQIPLRQLMKKKILLKKIDKLFFEYNY